MIGAISLTLALTLAADITILGENYCESMPNSGGHPATIQALGDNYIGGDSPADGAVTFVGDSIPEGSPIVLLVSQSQGKKPFGSGFACLGAPFYRVQTGVSQPFNFLQLDIFLDEPQYNWIDFAPGEWNFQMYYRDPSNNFGANFTDAVSVSLF